MRHWWKGVPVSQGPNLALNSLDDGMEVCIMARFSPSGEVEQGVTKRATVGCRTIVFNAKPCSNHLRNSHGIKVNADQKPVAIFKQILPLFLARGASVLIGGFGAGGEISACVELVTTAWRSSRTKHSTTRSPRISIFS